jgi:hypothetical protein
MALMEGVQIWRPEYWKSVNAARKIIKGTASKEQIVKLLSDPKVANFLEKNPIVFARSFGVSPDYIMALNKGEDFVQQLYSKYKAAGGKHNPAHFTDVATMLKSQGEKLNKSRQVGKIIKKDFGGVVKNALESDDPIRSSLYFQEIYTTPFKKAVNYLNKKGEEGNGFAKWLGWGASKPMEGYQMIDQSFKLGTFLHLTQDGVSESTIKMMSNFMPRVGEGLEKVAGKGEYLYKLDPIKAAEAVGDMYMNYGAMPDFVKAMRGLPFMGAPFISFTYAMAAKTGKTIKYNPAAFNKIQLALSEIGGADTPLEKEALKSPYYQFLNKPGQVKLNAMFPMLGDNPTYFNMTNILPYLTLNMFQPSNRDYLDPKMRAVANIKDKLPIMQQPEGQFIWDNFIQPLILMHSNPPEEPIGQFGQPLYPKSANAFEKYAALPVRALADAVVPAGLAPLAILPGMHLNLPDKVVDYIPNFKIRNTLRATQNKGSTGVVSQTDTAESKTIRALASVLGLSYYKLKLKFFNK